MASNWFYRQLVEAFHKFALEFDVPHGQIRMEPAFSWAIRD